MKCWRVKMVDIAMCKDKMCPLHESCYRYNAIPNEHIQYYGHFQYDKYKQCEYYIPIGEHGKTIRTENTM